MRTSDICPTCSTYSNALCTLYNGTYLNTLDIQPLDSVEAALIKIEAFASTVDGATPNLQTVTDIGAVTTTSITVPSIKLDLTAAVTVGVGEIAWNAAEETVNLGLNGGSVLQLGQELHKSVNNSSGGNILNGTPVMGIGTQGNTSNILIGPTDMSNEHNTKHFLGLATQDIANGQNGKVTAFGKISGLQTNGGQFGETWVDGDDIWVNNLVIGELTNVEPTIGAKLLVAQVINANPSNGTLDVFASKGNKLAELHDVDTVGLVDGSLLGYDITEEHWKPTTDFMNLTTAQTVGGVKTFSADTTNFNSKVIIDTGSGARVQLTTQSSYISNTFATNGTLRFDVKNSAGEAKTGIMIVGIGSVYTTLLYDQNPRLQTTQAGVDITGVCDAKTFVSDAHIVATLPAGIEGERAYVTDATVTTFYSIVVGGGANIVPVFYNGTNWVIA